LKQLVDELEKDALGVAKSTLAYDYQKAIDSITNNQ
jgi:hypothetical protein